MSEHLYPELADEQQHLATSRRCREDMLSNYRRVLANPEAADDLTRVGAAHGCSTSP